MNNIEEIIQAFFIGLLAATFLLNTCRALKAIDLCKESLVLVNSIEPSIAKQIGETLYRKIYEIMFLGYSGISDNANTITYGRKLLAICRECGDKVQQGIIGVALADVYQTQDMYVEAIELYDRTITIMKEIRHRAGEATCYGNLGAVFNSLGRYIKAKKYLEKSLAISLEINDKQRAARCYVNLGSVFQSLSEHVQAKEYLLKAVAMTKEIGDRAGEATSYGNLGVLFHSLGQYVSAKEYHEKALAIRMEIGCKEGVATDYGNLGLVFEVLGQYVKAKEYHEKAFVIRREIGDRKGEASSYIRLGAVFEYLGQYVKAKEYYEKALVITLEIGDKEGEGTVNIKLGSLFESLGECIKAEEYLVKALAITVGIGDREGEASCYGNLGNVFESLGQYVKAKEYYEKALAITMEIGDRAGEASNYASLGALFHTLGEYVKAEKYLKKAEKITLEIGDRQGEAKVYESRGVLSVSLRNYREGKKHYDKALAIFNEVGSKTGEATVYKHLGFLLESIGDKVKAKEYYEKSLAITLQIGDRKLEALNYFHLGRVFQALDEYATAEEYLEKALSLFKSSREAEITLQCYLSLAFTKLSQGKAQKAFFYLTESVKKCEDLRGVNAERGHIKLSLADKHISPYKRLSALFCIVGNTKDALHVVELGRARALADLMATQYSAKKQISAEPQSWTCNENVMQNETNCTCLYISYDFQQVSMWLLKKNGAFNFRNIRVEEKTLHTRLAKVARNLDEFFAIMAESFRSFGILPEEVCEDRSFNDIEPKPFKSCHEESPETFWRGKDKGDPKPSLTLFHDLLINPVCDLLDDPEIIIVPDRGLYRVPFPALLDKSGKYLSETFRIRVVPSLTTLRLIQNSPADYHSQTGALIVGDPAVGVVIYRKNVNKKFVPLPGARKEAEMIGQLLGVEPLLGQHATKQAVLERINSVSLIHIAAHGNAERGEIALAPAGVTTEIPQEDDYLLKMSDISQVQVRAKLVVLSCCHSGRGQIRAEGVVGIARAFLGSGARSVLVSLWALDDEATEQLMSRFYGNLVLGVRSSESLHEAIKWMRENGLSEVHEWAPFMLIGDNVSFAFPKKVSNCKVKTIHASNYVGHLCDLNQT